MRRFYSPEINETTVISGSEANHIANVLRMQPGDTVILFDGSGYDYTCEITSVTKGEIAFRMIDRCYSKNEPGTKITLYSSAIKKDNLDFVMQKTSELGVSRFCVFDSARSVKKIKDPEKLEEHLLRVGIEASKQCGRSLVPEVEILGSSRDVAERIGKHDLAVFAYEEEKTVPISSILETDAEDIAVIIGPEGGFEKEEADLFVSSGAKVCSLGKLILRAETAGIAAVSMIMYQKELVK